MVIERAVRLVGRWGWSLGLWGLSKRKGSRRNRKEDEEEGVKEAQRALDTIQSSRISDHRAVKEAKVQLRNMTDSIHTKHVLDAIAAYVFVKMLLPLRLVLSIGLTPVVMRRMFMRSSASVLPKVTVLHVMSFVFSYLLQMH